MKIRQEEEKDFDKIYDMIETAFKTAKMSDGHEQYFPAKIRNSEKYLPQFALVAEDNGQIKGHIMLSKTYVEKDGGRKEFLMLAPLSVALEERGRGLGAALVNEAISRAKKEGRQAVFLAGDPKYYSRFGFVPARIFDIYYHMPLEPDLIDCIMALELKPGALKNISGTVVLE